MHSPCNPTHRPDQQRLKRLLSERNQTPDCVPAIDDEIRRAFGRQAAILALDMCGFSRLTAKYGIIHFLAMIHQMEEAACPAVKANGGIVIKQDADNLFAIFPEPAQALEASLDIFRAFEAMNAVVPEDRDIYGSIGIGYGETLVIDEEDLFGPEMNLACKLGEDIAGKMEILLTAAAQAALPPGCYACARDAFTISGFEIQCYRFQQCLFPGLLDFP